MNLVIRAATVDDAPAIAALERLLFGDEAWSAQQVVDELSGPGRRAWVTADLTGYVITMTIADLTDLQRIAVHPDRQRQGLAGVLLDRALADVDRMLLEVAEDNHAALAFYRRHGFEEIDRRPRYYRNGAAAIVMSYGR